MVCADVLAREGIPVRLVADPAALGRSFRRQKVDGVGVEAGARLLELDYGDNLPSPDPDPRGYEPGEHRWHMGLIRTYLEGLVVPEEAKLWIDREGRTSPDFLLTSNLHELAGACSRWELGKIHREALAAANVLGPDGIDQRTLFGMTYRAASITVHGWAFHKIFVEPILDLILGTDGDLPAIHHRRVWLPLFTPGEILDAVRGQSKRPVRKLYWGMGAAVEALVARVEPLLGAALPPGPVDVVQDAARSVGRSVRIRFIWLATPRPGPPQVVWKIGGSTGPGVFRGTQFGRMLCWECREDVIPPGVSFATRVADYALAEDGRVDAQEGFVGLGSFNEQIAQGISAAAWRMR